MFGVYHQSMAVEVDLQEAQTHLSELLDQAVLGEDVIITRAGLPGVRLTAANVAPSVPIKRRVGCAEGEFEIPDSFYDPLPDDILDAFYK
jgi:prevent-host-death family protein